MAVIFHIEDESSVRLLYKEVFEEQGFQVIQASDAEEALKMLRGQKPDLIILDLKMPGMGGRGFLERFCRMKLRIPLVISSAYPYFDADPTIHSVDAFIIKSGDLTELVEKVRELVNKKSHFDR
ncbi:MAG: response regulator [Pseudomonadota bacterium]